MPIWKGQSDYPRSPDQSKFDITPNDERQILMLNLVKKHLLCICLLGQKHVLQITPQQQSYKLGGTFFW